MRKKKGQGESREMVDRPLEMGIILDDLSEFDEDNMEEERNFCAAIACAVYGVFLGGSG